MAANGGSSQSRFTWCCAQFCMYVVFNIKVLCGPGAGPGYRNAKIWATQSLACRNSLKGARVRLQDALGDGGPQKGAEGQLKEGFPAKDIVKMGAWRQRQQAGRPGQEGRRRRGLGQAGGTGLEGFCGPGAGASLKGLQPFSSPP